MIQIAVLGISFQPVIEMLFRTEEVVDSSATTPLDENRRGVHADDLAVQQLN